ncbi:MAG: nucleotide sugar dehydrogenase, partial [Desulfovibrio sp.]|nr:nucleotide sugar dehydrogenase [Desulfovibrio sp.]
MISYADLVEKRKKVAVVGLGYVGLPLAVALAKHFDVLGFDIKEERVKALRQGLDNTLEVDADLLKKTSAVFTNDASLLSQAGVIIVAVPTPIDEHRNPDLRPVFSASALVGENLSKGAVVCYESTVYPGVTEEECCPILEAKSGLKFPTDFTLGYSPERINPGDKVHRLETICKIVSGSDEPTRELLSQVYGSVIKEGIHKASSIKVAEAAKVIENTQRDINIALMNELAMIFNKMGIDTLEVLAAAGSKWNFLPFRPGLVGGHCIGVDPYYLTYKAEEIGCHPEVILAGRRINDQMGKYVAEMSIKKLINANKPIKGAKIGILGFTFKENVPDIRNTRVIDIVHE